jgi:hypothetical protein
VIEVIAAIGQHADKRVFGQCQDAPAFERQNRAPVRRPDSRGIAQYNVARQRANRLVVKIDGAFDVRERRCRCGLSLRRAGRYSESGADHNKMDKTNWRHDLPPS